MGSEQEKIISSLKVLEQRLRQGRGSLGTLWRMICIWEFVVQREEKSHCRRDSVDRGTQQMGVKEHQKQLRSQSFVM